MKPEYVALLDSLRVLCGKNYKLFTADELAKSSGTGVTKEEIVAVLRRLDTDGYVDMRYCDGKEILLKPLDKPYSSDTEVRTEQNYVFASDDKKAIKAIIYAAAAFLGALLGGFIAGAVC